MNCLNKSVVCGCGEKLDVDDTENYRVRCPACGRQNSVVTVAVEKKTPKVPAFGIDRGHHRDRNTEDEQRQYKQG